MCNCTAEFEKEVVIRQPFKELKVTKAEFDKALIFEADGTIKAKPIIEMELTVEGRKRPVRRSVIYSHCPFCGKPFEYAAKAEKEVTL